VNLAPPRPALGRRTLIHGSLAGLAMTVLPNSQAKACSAAQMAEIKSGLGVVVIGAVPGLGVVGLVIVGAGVVIIGVGLVQCNEQALDQAMSQAATYF
jgi:hypothetical protein